MDAPDQTVTSLHGKLPPQVEAVPVHEVTLLFDTESGTTLTQPIRRPLVVTQSLARVLARAGALGGTSGPPLQFSTLLVALLVDEDPWLKNLFTAQQVDFNAIAAHRPYSESSLQATDHSALRPEYLTTHSARSAFEEAQRIARATSGAVLDTRHLMAAYPVLWNWHLSDFERFRIDRLEWARAVGAEMATRFPAERKYWERYADRASPVPLTSFSADVYTQEDLLDIDRSVDALALVMASTRTVTPLAIGVFGPWGSGKSFFMRHLQKRIVSLRADEQARIESWREKRKTQTATSADAPLYFGEIAQVEFNAWHYNEGNLVASLVEHLFRNLRILPDDGDQELADRRADMLRKLKVLDSDLATVDETIRTAQQKVEAANASVAQAQHATEQARREVRNRAEEIAAQNQALERELARLDEKLRSVTLPAGAVDHQAVFDVLLRPLAPFLDKVRGAIGEARERIFDWKEFFGRVLSTKGLVVTALCLAVPLVLWVADALEAQWSALMASVAVITTALGNALDVFRRSRQQFEAQLVELDREQQRRVQEAQEVIRRQQQDVNEAARRQLEVLNADLESRRQSLAACEAAMRAAAEGLARHSKEHDIQMAERVKAEEAVRLAKADLERLSSALLLEEFITERASTDEYRKQLGFLALVRRDIERLSKLIDDANRKWLAPDNQEDKPLINRIVLYIDDLDRCKESTVLAVLEAVHLLLAFPLFVCVVAVDPRWVEKCLRETRKQMFFEQDANGSRIVNGATATVGDYLEKIFQIPIWMSPIGSQARASLVNSLLGPTAAPQALAVTGKGAVPGASHQNGNSLQQSAFSALVARQRERPDPLQILPGEATFVGEIAELLSDRPRALKRFVNTYRLLKASLPDIDRKAFVTEDPSSPHRVCLIQLAFFTSHPRLASELVSKLEAEATKTADTAATQLPKPPISMESWMAGNFPDGSPLRKALESIPAGGAISLGVFQQWLPCTSRYLFHRSG